MNKRTENYDVFGLILGIGIIICFFWGLGAKANTATPQEWRIAVCDAEKYCITDLLITYTRRSQCEKARLLLNFKDATQCVQVLR